MTEKFVVGFNPTAAEWRVAKEIFVAIGEPQLARQPQSIAGYTLRFANKDAFERFIKVVEANGISASRLVVNVDRSIFPSQLRDSGVEAPLLWLQVESRPRGMGGPTYGTVYDLATGCPSCGTGARQVSALYLQMTDAPKGKAWLTLDNEILFRGDVVAAMQGCSGMELRQARSATDGRPLDWWQFIPLNELPPMAPSTEGVFQDPTLRCPNCSRDGFVIRTTFRIKYEIDLQAVPDVSHTFEHFGRSLLRTPFEHSHFAQPFPVVRGEVFERLVSAGVKNIAADPIDVLDTSVRTGGASDPENGRKARIHGS